MKIEIDKDYRIFITCDRLDLFEFNKRIEMLMKEFGSGKGEAKNRKVLGGTPILLSSPEKPISRGTEKEEVKHGDGLKGIPNSTRSSSSVNPLKKFQKLSRKLDRSKHSKRLTEKDVQFIKTEWKTRSSRVSGKSKIRKYTKIKQDLAKKFGISIQAINYHIKSEKK